MRGEHKCALTDTGSLTGSPPRAWGTRWRNLSMMSIMRITPTCVGNTAVLDIPIRYSTDHPHVRGEHRERINPCFLCKGSPPRAWGTQRGYTPLPVTSRITPTCVGNTRRQLRLPFSASDHPHVRGEHIRIYWLKCRPDGSPPRAWGTHWRHGV